MVWLHETINILWLVTLNLEIAQLISYVTVCSCLSVLPSWIPEVRSEAAGFGVARWWALLQLQLHITNSGILSLVRAGVWCLCRCCWLHLGMILWWKIIFFDVVSTPLLSCCGTCLGATLLRWVQPQCQQYCMHCCNVMSCDQTLSMQGTYQLEIISTHSEWIFCRRFANLRRIFLHFITLSSLLSKWKPFACDYE